MKTRDAGTFEGALVELISVLGVQKCAEVVHKSASLVRKWSDPDNSTMPTLEQALALDLEYAREIHCVPPLLQAYTNMTELEYLNFNEGEHVLPALLALQTAVCLLVQKMTRDSINPEQSEKQRQIDWREVLTQIDLVMRETRDQSMAINFWQHNLIKPKY